MYIYLFSDYNSGRDAAAELSTVKANLTEFLELSSLTEERDQLKASLTEMTEQRNRLQTLDKQGECRSQGALYPRKNTAALLLTQLSIHNIILTVCTVN